MPLLMPRHYAADILLSADEAAADFSFLSIELRFSSYAAFAALCFLMPLMLPLPTIDHHPPTHSRLHTPPPPREP